MAKTLEAQVKETARTLAGGVVEIVDALEAQLKQHGYTLDDLSEFEQQERKAAQQRSERLVSAHEQRATTLRRRARSY